MEKPVSPASPWEVGRCRPCLFLLARLEKQPHSLSHLSCFLRKHPLLHIWHLLTPHYGDYNLKRNGGGVPEGASMKQHFKRYDAASGSLPFLKLTDEHDDATSGTPKGHRLQGKSRESKTAGTGYTGTKAPPAASEGWPGWWGAAAVAECPCDVTSEDHVNVQREQAWRPRKLRACSGSNSPPPISAVYVCATHALASTSHVLKSILTKS